MSKPYQDEELLREMYLDRGMKMAEIGDELGCSTITISRWLRKYDIKTRSSAELKKLDLSEELLRELYIDKEMDTYEIADKLGCVHQTVSEYLKKYNIVARGTWEKVNLSEEFLREMYIENGRTTCEVADELECSDETVRKYLHRYNIPIRSISDYYDADQEDRGNEKHQEWRLDVYERDNYTCQDCNKRGGKIHAHHIVPWSESKKLRFNIDNGVTLCKDCHADRHEQRGDQYHELIRNS